MDFCRTLKISFSAETIMTPFNHKQKERTQYSLNYLDRDIYEKDNNVLAFNQCKDKPQAQHGEMVIGRRLNATLGPSASWADTSSTLVK